MVKDIIEYNGKEFQLSTIALKEYANILETMIFPIDNGVVSGSEVFCFRTLDPGESHDCHADIYYHPEKYVNEEAIKKYKEEKEKMFE